MSISVARCILLGVMLFASADATAGEAWHHLTASQLESIINTLAPTHLRPVAPAYLPPGFRVVVAEADASTRYANGDYDPGFRIEYRGPNDQCFGLSEDKSGSRGLQQITSVRSAIGAVAIYRDPYVAQQFKRESLSAFPAVGIFLITPGYLDQSGDPSPSETCKPISLSEFTKVAESLRWLKK
jgi:hypothetical protein